MLLPASLAQVMERQKKKLSFGKGGLEICDDFDNFGKGGFKYIAKLVQ